MKKCFCILIFLFIPFVLLGTDGEWEFRTAENRILVEFEKIEPEIPENPNIYKTIACPYPEVKIVMNKCEVSIYGENGNFIKNQIVPGNERVELVDSFIMRELIGHRVRINLISEENGYKKVIKQCNFELVPLSQSSETVYLGISTSFLPAYRSIVDNFDESYLGNLQVLTSHMLIITPQYMADFLSPFVDWKEARGITCTIATLTETGETSPEIKSFIQNAYETWENPPDYLLLIGDVELLPSFYFGDENNVTDHPYTLLEGDDYFPEILVGRLSINSLMELSTIINKILKYEKEPYMENPEWLKRALLVAGNYSESTPIPTTPVKVSRWLYDKMIDYGYTQVDTIFYPPTWPGTSEIASAINNGVGFVSYR
ncbi:MAG: C25 family cysteine peptidase, partial [Candidatus Cloacimonadia bacterium]